MTLEQLFARTAKRYQLWDATADRNADIRRRIRSGQPVEQVAKHYSLPVDKAARIAGLFGA